MWSHSIHCNKSTYDLKVIQWDGDSFNNQGEIEIDLAVATYGSAEIVYVQQSGDALILWNHHNSSQIYFFQAIFMN